MSENERDARKGCAKVNEKDVLGRVRALFDEVPDPSNLVVANGDDGAVFTAGENQVVVSTDMAVENVHFRLEWSSPKQIGQKITAANLADICAMGGWPEYLLVSLAFPQRFLPHLEQLALGIRDEARKVGAKVIGGDLSSGQQVVVSITAIGKTMRAIRRSGMNVGDRVFVSHLPGWSSAGLYALQKGLQGSEFAKAAIAQHLEPQLDYQKYQSSFEKVHAATDVSDGLLVDLGNLAASSKIRVDLNSKLMERVPSFAELSTLAQKLEINPLDLILSGGEDHVLLVASNQEISGFHEIGVAIPGEGVFLDGKEVTDKPSGFQHQW